ncbi:outer membrane protein TolC [Larkinella arboricola]|uniref:Outer membrane protein TolC n=1 Tax=Larkinella arboricola TaxID=643671 RepID=A0A327XA83_LARAB|nr:TolC family protein [Larkinella arboricola]RAK02532.1 outer membrane protein TolC [Larkinella arboricola]
MKSNSLKNNIAILLLVMATTLAHAQQSEPLSLQKAVDLALQNNRSLTIKKLQVAEKRAKVREDETRKYPSVTVNSTYQYNVNLGQLVIPQGSFGALPVNQTTVVPLPNEAKTFNLGQHNTFNAGATAYQPLTQLGKIKTGLAIDQTDVQISEQEQVKVALQIRQGVERLYYGMLITQKQKEEATAKLELAKLKLYDVESALLSGKTIDASKAGLQASIADEEQNLLKLNIQIEDYTADLKHLTGLTADQVTLEGVDLTTLPTANPEEAKATASKNNVDLKLATLGRDKAELAIKAAQQSYRPDVGLVAGYTYQVGNLLFPTHNPFAGVNFKWNIQDLFANKQVLNQRNFLRQQAQENIANTQEQVNNDIEKAYRKINQATALINVAQRAVQYRTEELKVQNDRKAAGLNLQADILTTQSQLAKAQADLLAAQLNYRLAQSELKILTGER